MRAISGQFNGPAVRAHELEMSDASCRRMVVDLMKVERSSFGLELIDSEKWTVFLSSLMLKLTICVSLSRCYWVSERDMLV